MKENIDKWIINNIKINCFKDKTIVITGGHSGIGYEASLLLSKFSSNIIWASRNINKANLAKEKLLKENPLAKISVKQLDLASFDSIHKFVNDIIKNNIAIDIFYHNAGVYRIAKSYTQDKLDLTIGTNYIGVYLLNDLLMNHFIKTNQNCHFILTSSVMAYFYKIDYSNFLLEKKYKKIKAYCYSKKMIDHLFKSYISNEYPLFKFSLIHPGSTYTPLIEKGYNNNFFKKIGKTFMTCFFHSPKKASLSSLLAISKGENAYYGPRGLFGLSGYPKKKKLSKSVIKNYQMTIQETKAIINKIEKGMML